MKRVADETQLHDEGILDASDERTLSDAVNFPRATRNEVEKFDCLTLHVAPGNPIITFE